jgi:hypothetical protein
VALKPCIVASARHANELRCGVPSVRRISKFLLGDVNLIGEIREGVPIKGFSIRPA